jgi:DDE superfamily endonuclease
MPTPTSPLGRLGGFRTELHACFTRRADALFDLADALLCAPAVPSVAHLSLEPAHRRGWGSAYDALASGGVDTERLRDLLVSSLPDADPLVFAVDVTTWPRCDAECSPERGYYYHPSRHSAGQPIIAGWAWQWICQLSFDRDSWTAPVDACRLHPLDDTDQQAARQVRALLERLPAGRAVPLFVFDGGYDSAQLTLDLGGAPVAVLVRLRSDRCFYADPPPPPPGKTGRPRRHGAKFNCADPATWPTPTATLTCQDDQYGTVTVTCWVGLYPKQQRHPGHGSGGPRPIVRGTVIRVQVERVPARTRPPKVLWLWWAGPDGLQLDLDRAWRAYTRRFDLEIVCTQVTKPRVGAGWGGRDHVADLHLAVGHHHPVDQQLHQLAALLEAGPVKAHPQLLQHRRHRLGDRAQPDQPLTLGGDLPLARQQVRLLPGKGPVLALEAGQVDHLGQVGLQQPLPLAGHARPHLPQGRLPAAEFLGHPGAAVGALQGLRGQVRPRQDRAQVRPHQLVELGGGDDRAGQQLERPELTRACLPRQR